MGWVDTAVELGCKLLEFGWSESLNTLLLKPISDSARLDDVVEIVKNRFRLWMQGRGTNLVFVCVWDSRRLRIFFPCA